jgi:hypothetical protein
MKTKYQPDFPERAKKMAEEGLLDDQIAGQLSIDGATYYRYHERYREFREAIKEGKRRPNEEVEAALFKTAIGYTVQERHVELGPDQKPKKITVVDKHIAPVPVSIIFWLKNRMREKWRDVRQIEAQVSPGRPQLPDDMKEEDFEVVTANLKRLMPELFDGKQRAGKN